MVLEEHEQQDIWLFIQNGLEGKPSWGVPKTICQHFTFMYTDTECAVANVCLFVAQSFDILLIHGLPCPMLGTEGFISNS